MVGAFRAESAEWAGNYKSYLRELTKEVAGIFDDQSLMRSVNLYASRATAVVVSVNARMANSQIESICTVNCRTNGLNQRRSSLPGSLPSQLVDHSLLAA